VNLGAVLPGWLRVEAAEKWLSMAVAQRKRELKGVPVSVRRPPVARKPVKSSGLSTPHERRKLLDDFETWTRQSADAQPTAKQ
jgi:hypothetical protein